MKKAKRTFIAIMALGLTFASQAQTNQVEEPPKSQVEYKNQFFMLPTNLADNLIQFGYERKLSSKNSFMLQAGLYLSGTDALSEPTVNGQGVKLEADYNLIFDNVSKRDNYKVNFYISPYVNYFNATFKIGKDYFNKKFVETVDSLRTHEQDSIPISSDGNAQLSNVGFGSLFGLRWTISNRLVFDFYAGGGGQLATYSGEKKYTYPLKEEFISNFIKNGIMGRAGVRVGILF